MRTIKTKAIAAAIVLSLPLLYAWWTRADAFTTTLNVEAIRGLATREGTTFSFDQVVEGPWDFAIVRSGYDSSPMNSQATRGLQGTWRLPLHVHPEHMHDGVVWFAFVKEGEVVGYWPNEPHRPPINLGELEQRGMIRRGKGEEFIAMRESYAAGFEVVAVKER